MDQRQYVNKPAGFWIRFFSYIVDLIIVGSIGLMITKPIMRLIGIDVTESGFFAPYTIISYLTFFLYFVLMTKYLNQTVGKMIFGIRVISIKHDQLLWSTVLFRELVVRYISRILWIPYLLVAFMPNKQSLADIVSDTLVVHEEAYEKKAVQVRQNPPQLHEESAF